MVSATARLRARECLRRLGALKIYALKMHALKMPGGLLDTYKDPPKTAGAVSVPFRQATLRRPF